MSVSAKPTPDKGQTIKPRHRRSKKQRPPLIAETMYSRREAVEVTGLSLITIIRAYEHGHLQVSRVGSRVLIRGQQLLNWMADGGKTHKVTGATQTATQK